jgi:hypothetical protein
MIDTSVLLWTILRLCELEFVWLVRLIPTTLIIHPATVVSSKSQAPSSAEVTNLN